MKIRRALISVSDKTGLSTFAHGLHELGVELISTSGTAAFLEQAGVPVTTVEELTGVGRAARRPGEDAAPVAARRDPRPARPRRRHGLARGGRDRADRPRRLQPVPVPVGGRAPGRVRGRGDREHRHRRPDDGARGGEELPLGGRRHRARPLRLRARRAELRRRRALARHPPRPGRRGVRAHRLLRRRDRGLVHRHRAVPRPAHDRPGQGRRPGLRREPAPAGRVLPRGRRPPARALAHRPA